MTTYALADAKTQWFADRWPGSRLNLTPATAVEVLHTTEGFDWPDYEGGSKAPNYTAKPDFAKKALRWRAHFPDEMSSRALVNADGGVETNTLNANQVELIGTCNPSHKVSWLGKRAGVDYIYWPDAPDWALDDLAAFLRDRHERFGLVLAAPTFQAYPGSAGARGGTNKVRMTFDQWRSFAGICGHQHVPENVHGDPGDINIARILELANPAPKPVVMTRGPRWDALIASTRAALKIAKPGGAREKALKASLAILLAIPERPK